MLQDAVDAAAHADQGGGAPEIVAMRLAGRGAVVSAEAGARSATVRGGALRIEGPLRDDEARDAALDFVLCDRVLGCAPNVLEVLATWIARLRADGTLAIVETNHLAGPAAKRLPATPNHLLHDYILGATRGGFESREHLYIDFVCHGLSAESAPRDDAIAAGHKAVHAAAPTGVFHILNAPTLLFSARTGARLAGRDLEVQLFDDAASQGGRRPEHALVATCPRRPIDSETRWLKELRATLPARLGAYVLDRLDGRTAVSLSGDDAGKLFHIQDGQARWVRDGALLASLGVEGDSHAVVDLDGRRELVGEPIPAATAPPPAAPDRKQLILDRIPYATGRGLEMSPGARPIIERGIARDVVYCDKVDITDWKKTYANEDLDVYDVVVLGDQLIDEVFGAAEFDYIVSSHVLEHIPDFIQFFVSAARVLRPHGKIVKLVPDKRYTFDVLRRESTVDDIEQAHREKLRHPSWAMIEDVFLHMDSGVTPTNIWDGSRTPAPDRAEAEARVVIAAQQPEAIDLHCFTFTPTNFRVLIDHVIEHYAPSLDVVHIGETRPYTNEFLIELRKTPA